MSHAKKRYLAYLSITLFVLGVPFITVNGNHLLLLSFEKFQFHFLGYSYSVGEFYIMPFLLIFLFIGVIALTSMLGRVWCGWGCPQTIFRVIYRDLIEGTLLDLRNIKNKQKEKKYSKAKTTLLKTVAVSIWSALSVIIATNFILYFVPYEDFFRYMQNPLEHIVMIGIILSLAAFLLFDIVYLKENFCTFICPYSSTQTVLYDDDTKHVIYNMNRGGNIYNDNHKTILNMAQFSANEECTTCEACVKICPTHIDIRKGFQLECINCLECSDACTTVMGKLGKESLIYWGSINNVLKNKKTDLFNKKNTMFSVVLMASILFGLLLASEKEYVLVTAEKSGPLYRVDEKGVVYNSYLLAVHNTQNQAYSYDVKIQDNADFRVRRFDTLELPAGKRAKRVLVIEKKSSQTASKKANTLSTLDITVFAKENPSIRTTAQLAFVYPGEVK